VIADHEKGPTGDAGPVLSNGNHEGLSPYRSAKRICLPKRHTCAPSEQAVTHDGRACVAGLLDLCQGILGRGRTQPMLSFVALLAVTGTGSAIGF
jgi:hypothetical protein